MAGRKLRAKDIETLMLPLLREAGVDPAIIYAFQKTGRLVTEENVTLLTPEDLAEWQAALAEYRREHPED